LRNLTNQLLDITGTVIVSLTLQPLKERKFELYLYILNDESFQGDIILGREFFKKEKLTLIYQPAVQGESGKINFFSQLPLFVDDGLPSNTLEQIIENSRTNNRKTVK